MMKPAEDGDFLHSSGFGKVQNGDSIGVAGGANEKRVLGSERKLVGGYDRSGVMGAARMSGARPKTYAPPAPKTNTRPLPPKRGI